MASHGDDGAALAAAGDTLTDAVQTAQPATLVEMVETIKAQTKLKPFVPPELGVPIQGHDSRQGYPWPTIKRYTNISDARNLMTMVKLRESSQHAFNYTQPNTVRYYADLVADQALVASAYVSLLEARGIYGIDTKGIHPRYKVTYDDNHRELIFIANDKEAAKALIEVGKEVQELVGGKEDKRIMLEEAGIRNYGATIAEETVDFKAPKVVVKHKEVAGLLPAIIVRLQALGVAPNEESAEGKSALTKIGVKIEEWNVGGKDDEETGIAIFNQHWSSLLGIIAHVQDGPGGAKDRDNRTKALTEQGYGPEAAELIMRGFPKVKFDALVKDIGVELKRETRDRLNSNMGSINSKCIGEAAVPLIKEALGKGVYLTAEALVNREPKENDRPSLDEAALDAAIRKAIEATPKAKRNSFVIRD